MKVFMISFDRALLGEGGGDAVERHRRYAAAIDKLTIVVVSRPGKYQHLSLGDKLETYPTNANTWWGHARAIGGYFFSVRAHEGIDVVASQDLAAPVAYALAFITRTPFVASVHGVWWDDWFRRKRWWHQLYLPFLALALRRADAVRTVSERMKELLITKGVRVRRITVIPTPVDIGRFAATNDAAVREIQARHEYPIVLSVGRLEREKGFEALLAAWKRVEASGLKAHLLIIGEGSERAGLEKIVSKEFPGGSVFLLGSVESRDLPPYYHAASVFALASVSESFGKVLVEAGAAGTPCVATETAGASEIILHGQTGYLVPVGNAETMADKIIALLRDEDGARRMGAQARERCIAQYDGAKVTEQVIKLWRRMARKKRL